MSCLFYNLNGAFLSIGVVPRDVDADVRSVVGSTEPLRGVCMPDGVDWPLSDFLGGAGLAAPDRGRDAGETPLDLVAEVTPSFVGRDGVVDEVTRRVGMRE